jgi:hypothetical protein
MELRKQFKTLAIVGLLVGLLLACFPALASADGYYWYMAQDTDIDHDDWDSNERITQMQFHPWTPGGPGAKIWWYTHILGVDPEGVEMWFPLTNDAFPFDNDDGDYDWEGTVYKYGYVFKAVVYRFNMEDKTLTFTKDSGAWTAYAHVCIDVYHFGYHVDSVQVTLKYQGQHFP